MHGEWVAWSGWIGASGARAWSNLGGAQRGSWLVLRRCAVANALADVPQARGHVETRESSAAYGPHCGPNSRLRLVLPQMLLLQKGSKLNSFRTSPKRRMLEQPHVVHRHEVAWIV
jgi:hypothetical protein